MRRHAYKHNIKLHNYQFIFLLRMLHTFECIREEIFIISFKTSIIKAKYHNMVQQAR